MSESKADKKDKVVEGAEQDQTGDNQDELKQPGTKSKADKKDKVVFDPTTYVFDKSKYMIEKQIEDTQGKIHTVMGPRAEFARGVGKCKLYAASKLGVTVERLAEAYPILNGKKIDGIMVNDLIDRYGYSNGRQLNRNQLAERYKLLSSNPIDIATSKLTEMLLAENVEVAYAAYINDKRDILDKELRGEMTGQA